jgi:hypothetical protein
MLRLLNYREPVFPFAYFHIFTLAFGFHKTKKSSLYREDFNILNNEGVNLQIQDGTR